MNPMQGCLDCNNFTYGFDIELVDELGQSISDIDYEISLGGNNKILKKGKTDGEGRIQVDGLPSKPLFLALDRATFLKEMQASRRHLRLGRTQQDSTVKPRAEQQGREYSYATVGQLINALPVIPDWPEKRALPHFHFPDKAPQGWLILPRGKDHQARKLTIEVCPFRAWVLLLHQGPEYSLVNAYNLALMSILAYADGERDEHGSTQGALMPYVEQVLTHLGRLPFKVNNQYLAPVVKDVPFSERYRHYEHIDTSSKEMGQVGDTQLLYLVSQEHAIVSWRGTASLDDVLTDGYGIQGSAGDALPGGKVHLGFQNAYQDVKGSKSLKDAISAMDTHLAGKPLFICGHSLGGALALIHAAARRADQPRLYTYGMPRVFDRTAVAQLTQLVHYRHINNNDMITAVPHPKWGSLRLLYALGMGVTGGVVALAFPAMRRELDSQDFQHHGQLVHFARFVLHYDAGPGFRWDSSRPDRQEAYALSAYQGRHVKTLALKTILAPSLIGASDQKAYELVLRQYRRTELDNPDRHTVDGPDHSSGHYARYLGARLYDRLCPEYGAAAPFDKEAKAASDAAIHSLEKAKSSELAAFLQADKRVLAQSLLPLALAPNESHALVRYYRLAMTLPLDAIREEQAAMRAERAQLLDDVSRDRNYQLRRDRMYLEPGIRANLPKVDDEVLAKQALAERQTEGIDAMSELLQ
jgi:hypothetical protein